MSKITKLLKIQRNTSSSADGFTETTAGDAVVLLVADLIACNELLLSLRSAATPSHVHAKDQKPCNIKNKKRGKLVM